MKSKVKILILLSYCAIFVFIGGIANGAKTIYRANFSQWPSVSSEHGYVGPQGSNYTLSAKSNTWMGPGRHLPITPLRDDFIMNINFKVVHKKDCSLSFTLSDAGQNYSRIAFYFDMWKSGKTTFSIYEQWVRNNFYVDNKTKIASRLQAPQNLASNAWTNVNTLSFRRVGNIVGFYCNNQLLKEFQAPKFDIRKVGVGIAFESRVMLTSMEAKTLAQKSDAPSQNCMGVNVGGYCWYQGAEDESCSEVCASHGGYHEATRYYAGSDGTNENCKAVLGAFGFSSGKFFETAQGGLGCFIIGGAPYRYRDKQHRTEASAKSVTPGRRRVCACQN
jgi:hypothetical protein